MRPVLHYRNGLAEGSSAGRGADPAKSLLRSGLSDSMPAMRGMTSLTAGIGVIVFSALVGGLFGGRVLAQQESMSRHFDAFASALAAVEAHFVDEVDTERLVYRAIGGMLQTLDPHSNFMDPRSYSQLRERQEGRYYGLGISHQRHRRPTSR